MSKYRGVPAGYETDEDSEDTLVLGPTQKIKIIKDRITIGAGLNGTDFNASLSAPMDNWFDNFRQTYNTYKRNPLTEQQLKLLLIEDENPLLLALKFFAISPGCNNLKNKNLALFVLELICDLAAKNPNLTEKCDDNTRMVAFNFIKTCGVNSIYKAVIKAYGLKSIRPDILPKLQEMLQQGFYKDVAFWAIFLDMTESFGIYDLLFPLLLQDKISLAEEYMDIAQNLQLPMVQFLDSMLDKQKPVIEHCDAILAKYRYINIRHGILLYKPMSKLVTRLAKKYKIDEQQTPNLVFSKSCGYLRFLFYKYREGGMNLEAWRELIPEVANSKEIQLELLKTLTIHGEFDEAARWLENFELPLTEIPNDLRPLLDYLEDKEKTTAIKKQNQNETTNLNVNENLNSNNAFALNSDESCNEYEFLKLNLHEDQILLINDDESFNEMLKFLKTQSVIAFDSEWKPSVSKENAISLLQIATFDRVYLIDCLTSSLTSEKWRIFGREIFNNLEILKIGFAIEHDLRLLQKSLPLQMSLHGGRPCFLDLHQLWRRLKFMEIIDLPYGSSTESGEGLSALTEACFGKKLDKSNQCSNWTNRPLRPDQITYAALDAFCLLQIYQIFTELLHRAGFEIDKVVEEITTGKTGYLFRMKTIVMSSSDAIPSSSNSSNSCEVKTTLTSEQSLISITDIGFVCDMDLSELSRELRKLGIHCIHMKSVDSTYMLSELEHEKCFLLTRQPKRHSALLGQIGWEKCVKILPANVPEQVVFVLNHFKIQVQERHFFTRCIECNSNEFIFAYKEEIIKMRKGDDENFECKRSQDLNISRLKNHNRNFLLLTTNEHIFTTKTTYRGKPIRLHRIKDHHLKRAQQFFICDSCGYVIWNGAHSIHGHIAKVIGFDPQSFPEI